VEKTAKQGEMMPVSTSQLFAVLQSRISKQDALIEKQSEKIGLLLEIIHYQNKAIKSSKAIDSGLMENASAADICISDLLADCLSKEADTEAA
jgi:hypothetical protein